MERHITLPAWRRRLAGCFLLGFAASGCGTDEPRVVVPEVEVVDGREIATIEGLPDFFDPAFRWTFQVMREVPTVVADDSEPLVFDPAAALPLDGETLLVHDPTADRPLVVVDVGRRSVLARFGHRGRGPGELGDLLTFHRTKDGFAALDGLNNQIHRYGALGASISSEPFIVAGRSGKRFADPTRAAFLVETFERSDDSWHRSLARLDIDSGRVEPFLRLPDPPANVQPGDIQHGRPLWTVVGDNVVAMWSDRPVVSVYGPEGHIVREIRLPLTRRTLTARDIQEQIEYYGNIASGLEPGPAALTNELFPVNDSVFAMLTSQLWKAVGDPPFQMGDMWWRLFTVRGRYLGIVPWSQDFRLLVTTGGALWASIPDSRAYPVIVELRLIPDPDPSGVYFDESLQGLLR